ncbi:hypothetical protein ACFMQL_20690 [Nonomuraea fastidiosa]|uniref:hypothetical protein n=1 Tax=Nonomuraea fastidiosa TaxID=46173 RepID=UPI003672AD7F
MDIFRVIAWAEAHPVLAMVIAGTGVVVFVLAIRVLRLVWRVVSWLWARYVAPRPVEDVLTIVAASIATGVSAQGMWRFSGDVLGLDGPLRLLLFAFIEVAIITSAVRARRNMRENYSAGLDGIAVWALTCLTAVLSSMDARTLPEAVFRLAAPLVAAWLWERGMAIERHRIRGTGRINWRITPERMLVRLGLAETRDRTAQEVDAHRRLTRVALAAKKAKMLREGGASERKIRAALAKLDKAMDQAVEHTGLAVDQSRQEALLAQIAALYNTSALIDAKPASPWEPAKETPVPRSSRRSRGRRTCRRPHPSPLRSRGRRRSRPLGRAGTTRGRNRFRPRRRPRTVPGRGRGRGGGRQTGPSPVPEEDGPGDEQAAVPPSGTALTS